MTKIPLEKLENVFRGMRAQTPWNVDGPLLWGYFFTDPDDTKLSIAAAELSSSGYRVVKLYRTDDGSTFFLHVERVEHHTPASLDARNQQLYDLAERHGLASYDGMDVGPRRPWWKFW
jgi:hypothetical protein